MSIRPKVETVVQRVLSSALDEHITEGQTRKVIEALSDVGYRVIGPRVGVGGEGSGSGITTEALRKAREGGEDGIRSLAETYGMLEEEVVYWSSQPGEGVRPTLPPPAT